MPVKVIVNYVSDDEEIERGHTFGIKDLNRETKRRTTAYVANNDIHVLGFQRLHSAILYGFSLLLRRLIVLLPDLYQKRLTNELLSRQHGHKLHSYEQPWLLSTTRIQ